MTDYQLNRAIAESIGWRLATEGDRHGNRFWNRGDEWRRVGDYPKTYEPLPNYLDEKNPGPAHELIEVLRGEGWRVRLEMPEILGPKDYVRIELFRPSEQRGPYYAPTFCRAVAECFAKVKGIWKE